MSAIDLVAVMDEITARLEPISGLRAYGWPTDAVAVPACVVGYPETIEFDQTYQRSSDRAVFPVYLCVGTPYSRTARDNLAKFIIPVKDMLDGMELSAQTARGSEVEIQLIQLGQVEYLAAVFQLEVIT